MARMVAKRCSTCEQTVPSRFRWIYDTHLCGACYQRLMTSGAMRHEVPPSTRSDAPVTSEAGCAACGGRGTHRLWCRLTEAGVGALLAFPIVD